MHCSSTPIDMDPHARMLGHQAHTNVHVHRACDRLGPAPGLSHDLAISDGRELQDGWNMYTKS